MSLQQIYRTYLVPAAVFQGVIIGGGYGTGREVVEYVSRHGPLGGLFACLTIAIGFALVLAASFAFAKRFASYDYRHFLQELIGPAWVVYEMLFVILLVIVLAVVAAAAGDTAGLAVGMPYPVTLASVMLLVVMFNFYGRHLVEQALTVWSVLLMAGLLCLLAYTLKQQSPGFIALFTPDAALLPAVASGARFAIYNSALIPVLLYCTTDINNCATAARAGLFAGFFGALPALLLHLIFVPHLALVVEQSIPTWWVLHALELTLALKLYYVLLFGTLVLTAVGVLQGVNERIDGLCREHGYPPLARHWHGLLAGAVVLVSLGLAEWGIVALVARGYGALSWGFLLVFTLPLLTRGVMRTWRAGV